MKFDIQCSSSSSRGLTSHSTHFRSFQRPVGDYGISRIIAAASHTVCAVLSSVCATTVDNSGVYVYYLKSLCPYVLDAWLGLGFSGTCLYRYLQVHVQPTKLSDAQVLPNSRLGGNMRGLQPGGHVHKEAVHLLSLQPTSIMSSGTFKPECNGPSQFREDRGGPSMPVREFNLITCPLVQSS